MENSDFFIGIAQQALYITALATAPILIPALPAGVVLGMIQAPTPLNAATLSFVPKLILLAVMLALFGGSTLLLHLRTPSCRARAPTSASTPAPPPPLQNTHPHPPPPPPPT